MARRGDRAAACRRMKILIDMNLSPDWVNVFADENITSVHWSTVGDPRAEDTAIIQYAQANDYVILAHDLDFGTILALNHATGPSVIQVRTQDILPSQLVKTLVSVLRENETFLEKASLI